MSQATLEELKERQRKIAVKIRIKEAELKRAERRKRAHVLIQCGALVFTEQTMKKHGWSLSDIESAIKDPAQFKQMILKALEPLTTGNPSVRQPLTTPTTTAKTNTTARPSVGGTVGDSAAGSAKAQPAGGSGVSPARQSVPNPHQ